MVAEVEIDRVAGAEIIRLAGDLSDSMTERLEKELDNISQNTNAPLIIDMSRLDFVDSKGAGYLLKVKYKFSGRKMAVSGIPSQIRNVLERLGVLEQFRTFNTLDDALKRV